MFTRYDITHRTLYRYKEPVTFGEHRVMFRPRDSHDLRVLGTDLQVSPTSAVRLIQDPHSNSIAVVQPLQAASELQIVCTFAIEQAASHDLELPLADSAVFFPFSYGVEERFDLEPYMRPHYDDPAGELTWWARQFLATGAQTVTREMLVRMNQQIRDTITYVARDEEGTQPPLATLQLRSGSCRDLALLMIEAVRRLGIAARFVSGYLYDPALDLAGPAGPSEAATVGAGGTHAWLQVYLPVAGWLPFDPTNNFTGSSRLIRVGVARDPRQAASLSGSWFGPKDAYLGMEVDVKVTRRAAA